MEGLSVQLDDERLVSLSLPNPLEPTSWTLTYRDRSRKSWEVGHTDFLKFIGDRDTYISVDQEQDGQHLFVRVNDALDSVPVLISEAEVKAVDNALKLYARKPAPPPSAVVCDRWNYPDIAPHGAFTNYSVVPWLSLGKTHALILTDEATLTRTLPRERIFDYVTLIVNCHEDRPDVTKYRACSGRPEVIAHAVHRWFSHSEGTVDKNDQIQRIIWYHIQRGSVRFKRLSIYSHNVAVSPCAFQVAVHCLAGIHRAACIVACQFLFRHYMLRHRDVPADCNDIYRKLQSAYVDILRSYENYCKGRAAAVRNKA